MVSRRTVLEVAGAIAAILALVGCAGGATPPASTIAAASSLSPSPSAPPDSAGPALVLPTEAGAIEALLPNRICGSTSDKRTIGGDEAVRTSDDEFRSILQALGKQASDVSVAIATTSGTGPSCSATILRIKGADPALLEQTFLAVELRARHVFVRKTVAGRDVWFADSTGGLTYVMFNGDALIAAVAQDEGSGAEIVAALP